MKCLGLKLAGSMDWPLRCAFKYALFKPRITAPPTQEETYALGSDLDDGLVWRRRGAAVPMSPWTASFASVAIGCLPLIILVVSFEEAAIKRLKGGDVQKFWTRVGNMLMFILMCSIAGLAISAIWGAVR